MPETPHQHSPLPTTGSPAAEDTEPGCAGRDDHQRSTGVQSDLELLGTYEPVIRFTEGELFLPTAVPDYLRNCSLSVGGRGRDTAYLLAEPGTLDPTRLAGLGRRHDDEPLQLQFVAEPMGPAEYRVWRADPQRPRFRASSRFASVGLLSRLIDATMRLTLLLRGKVPKGYAAAAHRQLTGQREYPYYGRVTRDAGYIVLQYWYLYAMNDWRSSFGGVNDHEADWEQVTLFLTDTEDPVPAWVAFSSHDEVGDDLRRRWDDPDITFVQGTHPVVYAGAGSHSGAYLPGEYLVSVNIALPRPIAAVRRALTRVVPWFEAGEAFRIPYLDYRRGDGPAVGVGESRQWSPVVIDDSTDWVADYRGLWGLDTRDPLGGERAPAGPRYERDGSVRPSWRQPVAWAGLDKEPPTAVAAAAALQELRSGLVEDQQAVTAELENQRAILRGAHVADRAEGRSPRHPSEGTRRLQTEVTELRHRAAELADNVEVVDRASARPLGAAPVHAHLRQRALPLHAAHRQGLRQSLLRVWAAASASLLLGAAGVLLLVGYPNVVLALLSLVVISLVIEATLRGTLAQLIVNVALAAVILAALWGAAEIVLGNLRQGFGVLLLLAAAYMGWQTLREGLSAR